VYRAGQAVPVHAHEPSANLVRPRTQSHLGRRDRTGRTSDESLRDLPELERARRLVVLGRFGRAAPRDLDRARLDGAPPQSDGSEPSVGSPSDSHFTFQDRLAGPPPGRPAPSQDQPTAPPLLWGAQSIPGRTLWTSRIPAGSSSTISAGGAMDQRPPRVTLGAPPGLVVDTFDLGRIGSRSWTWGLRPAGPPPR
jgi:hypothetical protein